MKNLEPLTKSLIAHRGIHNEKIKDNSLLSIKKCLNKNIPIEIDLSLTKDKKIILWHDLFVKIKNRKKLVTEVDYNTIKKEYPHVITLSTLLEAVEGKVFLLIELKSFTKSYDLEKEAVKYLDNYKGMFAIQSFNPRTVMWFKRNRKDYIRGQLLHTKYNKNVFINYIYNHMIFNIITKPDFISCNLTWLKNEVVIKARNNLVVLGWTIKNKNDLKRYQNFADNFICDNILEIK